MEGIENSWTDVDAEVDGVGAAELGMLHGAEPGVEGRDAEWIVSRELQSLGREEEAKDELSLCFFILSRVVSMKRKSAKKNYRAIGSNCERERERERLVASNYKFSEGCLVGDKRKWLPVVNKSALNVSWGKLVEIIKNKESNTWFMNKMIHSK